MTLHLTNSDIFICSAAVILAIVLIVFGIKFLKQDNYLSEVGIKTTGRVVGANIRGVATSHSIKASSYKVIEFKTTDGKVITFEDRLGLAPVGDVNTDESVPVIYDPKDPQRAVMDHYVQRKMPWIITLVAGIGILISFGLALVYGLFFA